VPTLIEAGLRVFVVGSWRLITLPAIALESIIARINTLVNEVLQAEAMRARPAELGGHVASPMTPAEVNAYHVREGEL
jgi:tripartite-type tricarboxylate transporter receptor subunit TctC